MDAQKNNDNQGTARNQHGEIQSEDACPANTTTTEGPVETPDAAPPPGERPWCFSCVDRRLLVRQCRLCKQDHQPGNTYVDIVVPRKHLVRVSAGFYLRKTFVVDGEEFTVTDDAGRIKDLIVTSSSMKSVREFLHNEMEALEVLSDGDFVAMKRSLCKYRNCIDNPPENARVSRRRFFFRTMNMAIFGLHGLWEGKQQVKVLKEFVQHSKLSDRQALYAAYTYIFGYDKRGLDYFSTAISVLDSKLK